MSAELSTSPAGLRLRHAQLLILALFAGMAAAAILKVSPLLSANDRSRWSTVRVLVEHQNYAIDDFVWDRKWQTIDKMRYEGHFYSTKPPLFPTLVAGICWSVQQVSGLTLAEDTAEMTRCVLLLVNLLPMLAALIFLAKLLERYATCDGTKIAILAIGCFGTLLLPFLVTLNNHTVAAVSVVFTLYPTMRIIIDGERHVGYFLFAGFFAAFVCCNELPAALFSVSMFVLLFRAAPKQTACLFIPAALIPLAGFFYTNWLVTGGIKPFYMYNGQNPGPYFWEYEGVRSYWFNPKGLDRSEDTTLAYLWHCTFGHHGIFSLSPVFLITLAGWLKAKSWGNTQLKPFLWLGLGLTVAILGFYLTRTGNYNYGGNTAGLRWAFWLIPLWLIGMIPVLDKWGNSRRLQLLFVLFFAISVFSAYYPMNNPWRPPWLFNVLEYWDWIDYGG